MQHCCHKYLNIYNNMQAYIQQQTFAIETGQQVGRYFPAAAAATLQSTSLCMLGIFLVMLQSMKLVVVAVATAFLSTDKQAEQLATQKLVCNNCHKATKDWSHNKRATWMRGKKQTTKTLQWVRHLKFPTPPVSRCWVMVVYFYNKTKKKKTKYLREALNDLKTTKRKKKPIMSRLASLLTRSGCKHFFPNLGLVISQSFQCYVDVVVGVFLFLFFFLSSSPSSFFQTSLNLVWPH